MGEARTHGAVLARAHVRLWRRRGVDVELALDAAQCRHAEVHPDSAVVRVLGIEPPSLHAVAASVADLGHREAAPLAESCAARKSEPSIFVGSEQPRIDDRRVGSVPAFHRNSWGSGRNGARRNTAGWRSRARGRHRTPPGRCPRHNLRLARSARDRRAARDRPLGRTGPRHNLDLRRKRARPYSTVVVPSRRTDTSVLFAACETNCARPQASPGANSAPEWRRSRGFLV